MERPRHGVSSTARVAAGAVALALGFVGLLWLDHAGTRRELLSVLRDQAATLREAVAAAARSSHAAGRLAEAQLAGRLLDNARLLAELDRAGRLSQARLDEVARRHALFRVSLFTADGTVERTTGGAGQPHGPRLGGRVLERLLSGAEAEAATDVHTPRRGDGARLAAGVRRHGGGAIVLNADAAAVAGLLGSVSLDALLREVMTATDGIAYLALEGDSVRIVHGAPLPAPPPAVEAETDEREGEVDGRPVLELAGRVPLGEGEEAWLRLGMRLDALRRAERRLFARTALSLTAVLALAGLGVGTAWLGRKYSALSEEHARAEEALRRRDRLTAMGELAATVAHEVRNPLNAIAMSARRLRRELPEGPGTSVEARRDYDELLSVLEDETRRIDRKVQEFLAFARPPALAVRSTDLAALAAAAGENARVQGALRGVAVEVDAAGAGTAEVDADQLRQALDNLLRNAVEATPAGGRVRLTARRSAREHVLEVADTGPGIAEKDRPRIFDLYFTTKRDGTGVGLAVTHQVVTAHGGVIEVDSRPGMGTRMTVRLPAGAAAAVA
jgi:signal transduction histidine kinase